MSRFEITTVERKVTTTWRIHPAPRQRIVLPDMHTGQRYQVKFVIVTKTQTATEDPGKAGASFWGVRITDTGKHLDKVPIFFQPHEPSAQAVIEELEKVLKKSLKEGK